MSKLICIDPEITVAMLEAAEDTGFRGYNGAFHLLPDKVWNAMLGATKKVDISELVAAAQDALIALEAAPDTATTRIAKQKLKSAIESATS